MSSPTYLDKFNHLALQIGNIIVQSAQNVKNLGVIFDNCLNLKKQTMSISKSAYFQLRRIGSIRKYLNDNAATKLIHAFVTSRLDYCNSLLSGSPAYQLARLQRIQNSAARIVTRTRKYEHITPVLVKLHWLPIPLRITYKVLLLTYKTLHDLGPSYLEELLMPHNPTRQLRSSGKDLLKVAKSRLVHYGDKSFSVCAPSLWNDLPSSLRSSTSLDSFKNGLKTELFKRFINNSSLYMKK